MRPAVRGARSLAAIVLCLGIAGRAEASGGLYVAGADGPLYNDATTVVLMRAGTRTVLSIQPHYRGPAKDFALVVPVPTAVQKDQVKTLPRAVFERIEQLTAPRLVEYWERDPCAGQAAGDGQVAGNGHADAIASRTRSTAEPVVIAEAEFAVGEYEIAVLSAEQSLALETWLGNNGYRVPEGAAAYLRPYVERGSKFFVARVNASKLSLSDGRAELSPLRVHFDAEEFGLPVGLGLVNAEASQDLIVHILAPGQRYEVGNRDNVVIPTNLVVDHAVQDRFAEFYAALFDAVLANNPGAVVTEYAWRTGSCDPCPDSPMLADDLAALGLDVVYEGTFDDKWPTASALTISVERGFGLGPRSTAQARQAVMARDGHKAWTWLMQDCHRQAMRAGDRSPDPATVRFTLAADRKPTGTVVEGVSDEALRTCIEKGVNRLRFTKEDPPGKVRATLSFAVTRQLPPNHFVLTRLHARYTKDTAGDDRTAGPPRSIDWIFQPADPIYGGRGGADPESRTAQAGPYNAFQARYIVHTSWTGEAKCASPRFGQWGAGPASSTATDWLRTARGLAFAPRGQMALGDALRGKMPELGPAEDAPPAPAPTRTPPPPATKSKPESKGCGIAGDATGVALAAVLFVLAAAFRRRRDHLESSVD